MPSGGWYRPSSYWWRPGGTIAAGAALGFVTAAATAYAGPGLCWYYTNPQRTHGFWDKGCDPLTARETKAENAMLPQKGPLFWR
jgi:hypothetical protein